jgi:hypothetical protein
VWRGWREREDRVVGGDGGRGREGILLSLFSAPKDGFGSGSALRYSVQDSTKAARHRTQRPDGSLSDRKGFLRRAWTKGSGANGLAPRYGATGSGETPPLLRRPGRSVSGRSLAPTGACRGVWVGAMAAEEPAVVCLCSLRGAIPRLPLSSVSGGPCCSLQSCLLHAVACICVKATGTWFRLPESPTMGADAIRY